MIHLIAWISVISGVFCALFLLTAVTRKPDDIAIVNLVWPLIGLAGSGLAVWLYFHHKRPGRKPAWLFTALATCHCGSGCTLGDILSESAVLLAGYPARRK